MPSSGREVGRSSRVPDRAVRLIGAGSQVGYFLLPYLHQAGWRVIELHRGDLTRSRVAEGGAAICLAPLDVLPPLLPVLRDSGLERVVAFSTTSVLYKLGSGNAAERARILRIAAAEDDMAAYCTREGIAWTLFRPTLVYGCGRDRGIASIAGFVRRFGFFPVAGAASGLRQPVHADDLAHACVRVLDDHNSWAKAYTLSGGEVLTCRRGSSPSPRGCCARSSQRRGFFPVSATCRLRWRTGCRKTCASTTPRRGGSWASGRVPSRWTSLP